MTLHPGRTARTYIAVLGTLVVLSACGRSGTSAPAPITTNPFNTGTGTGTGTQTGTISTPLPPITGGGGQQNPPPDTSTPQNFTCTISLMGGTPTAVQPPGTPVQVQYLLAISPTVTSVVQPQISTVPANALSVTQLVPNGSQVTVTGNFIAAGSIVVKSTVNISGQMVNCQTTTQVTQGVPSTVLVYRFDRISPPDIFYATSASGPVNFRPAGAMFRVFSQAPSGAYCPAIPLNQCMLPRAPQPVTFLSQAAGCGGYPVVAQLGFSCSSQVQGTTPLYRMTNNIDFRYFATASVSDVQALLAQGWRYEGIIGYVPLQ
jgi:hypothetical protein